ncbi:variable surface protein [Plasmodium gonderi]|uniref:Variable surface protein n=1 Tax=Plasmodium gonderi TaxID=77519 RepID=A0A1Y1JNN0_PLAGO|nr:variable surface protein [Plasmodium gonderi]GAW84196.1 variable surface protein [Plasmodium gonderi]
MADNIVPLKYNDMRGYKFLPDFPRCEKIIQMNKDVSVNTYKDVCSSIASKFKGNNNNLFIQEICPKSLSYLYDVNVKGTYIEYRKAGCIYFPYWLYYSLKKINYSDYTKDIYNEMIKTYPLNLGFQTKFCTDYEIKTNEQLEDLIFLYNTYKCIKGIKTHNVSENYNGYCDILKKIINENQKPMPQEVHERAQSQKSTTEVNNIQEITCSCRSNIVNIIAITIILTLLILFFLLFYTSYGSLLRQRIKWIRKKLDNISNIRNTTKPIEVPTNIFNSRIYDMLYNQS